MSVPLMPCGAGCAGMTETVMLRIKSSPLTMHVSLMLSTPGMSGTLMLQIRP